MKTVDFSETNAASDLKEFVLLRRAISLKVNYEKVKFSNCVFCDKFSDYKLTYEGVSKSSCTNAISF